MHRMLVLMPSITVISSTRRRRARPLSSRQWTMILQTSNRNTEIGVGVGQCLDANARAAGHAEDTNHAWGGTNVSGSSALMRHSIECR